MMQSFDIDALLPYSVELRGEHIRAVASAQGDDKKNSIARDINPP